MPPIKVEICINSASRDAVRGAARAAYQGGASTIELCAAMHLHGLTPDKAHIEEARAAFERPGLMVMIRPRAGDFYYSPAEIKSMVAQIGVAYAVGADGVVLGALRQKDNRLSDEAMRELLQAASSQGLSVTFHRAFDATPDPDEALDTLIESGVERVLTNGIAWGQQGTALEGVKRIRRTIQRAGGRIKVVIGGGVSAGNVPGLLAQLPLPHDSLSLHAYSGAQEGGVTTVESVQALVQAARLP